MSAITVNSTEFSANHGDASDPAIAQAVPKRLARSRWSRVWLASAFAMVCLGSGFGFVRATQATAELESGDQARPLSVDVVAVSITDQFEKTVSFVGRVEAARESELSFERIGLIAEVNVDEGDTVTAMQPLAVLDTEKLASQRDVLTARLEAAKATLDELIAGPRKETIQAQRAEVRRLVSDLQRDELRRDRQTELLPRAGTSKTEYEAALYSAQSTQAALDAAKALLDELENGTRREQVLTQRAIVKQIEAERNSIDVDIRKSYLLAPFDGTIAERFVDEGRVTAAGQPIVRLLEISRPEIRVGVDSDTAASLSVCDSLPAIIHGEEHRGTIKAIRSDVAGRTRTVDVLLALEADQSGASTNIRSGDLANVEVTRVTEREGAWLPIGSLAEGSRGLWSVFVVTLESTNPIVERRDVEVLYTTSEHVFVRGAIGQGERVVASGVHRLVPGQRVHPKQHESATVTGEQDR